VIDKLKEESQLVLTKESISKALISLASNDVFLSLVLNELKKNS